MNAMRMERLGFEMGEGKSMEFCDPPKSTERGDYFKLHHEWMIVLYTFV